MPIRPAIRASTALLRGFKTFDGLPAGVLEAMQAATRRLRVPAGRWLVRPGRTLPGHVYLLDGRVRLLESGRSVIVNAGSARAQRAVYPGASGVQTLTAAVFLSVDPAALELLAGAGPPDEAPGVPEILCDEPSWQRRFLLSPLMQRLQPERWQRILRAMQTSSHPAGETVIRAGERADCCFVLCSGRAEIRAAGNGSLLAMLEPGCLFGEDALVSGRARNATVTMTAAGEVVSLAARRFERDLLDVVVQPLAAVGEHPLISLDGGAPGSAHVPLNALRLAASRLRADTVYAIVGGTWPERRLAAFLLAESGIEARPIGPA